MPPLCKPVLKDQSYAGKRPVKSRIVLGAEQRCQPARGDVCKQRRSYNRNDQEQRSPLDEPERCFRRRLKTCHSHLPRTLRVCYETNGANAALLFSSDIRCPVCTGSAGLGTTIGMRIVAFAA